MPSHQRSSSAASEKNRSDGEAKHREVLENARHRQLDLFHHRENRATRLATQHAEGTASLVVPLEANGGGEAMRLYDDRLVLQWRQKKERG
jgi:hypothetical protein